MDRSQAIFPMNGIRCNHCETSQKLTLHKVSGVKQVKVHNQKLVVVEFDAHKKTSSLEWVTATENAGYNVCKTPS